MQAIITGAVGLGLLWAIMTIGVYMTYRVLDIADLTVEGSMVLGASVAAIVIYNGGSPVLATLYAAAAGMVAGLITGLLHTKLHIPALLSGILCMIALYSINIRVMDGSANISLLRQSTSFTPLMDAWLDKNMSAIVIGLLASAAVVILVHAFLHTEIGYALRATGDSPAMARAQGIHTDRYIILGLMLSNGLVGLSGALIAQYLGFSDVQMGTGSIVIGLASLIIGEVLFGRGGSMLRTLCSLVLGAIAYRIIIALVFEAGMRATDLKLFTAITVAAALYIPQLRMRINKLAKVNDRGKAHVEGKSNMQDVQ